MPAKSGFPFAARSMLNFKTLHGGQHQDIILFLKAPVFKQAPQFCKMSSILISENSLVEHAHLANLNSTAEIRSSKDDSF